jgi:gluconolactonase
VWHPEGYYLFSDIPLNGIMQITAEGDKKIFLDNSGFTHEREALLSEQTGSNGLGWYGSNLLICQHGNGAIAKWDGAALKPFLAHYKGRPFNSPNDIITHSDGRFFFSDPPYGLKDQQLQPQRFQPLAGVYCCGDGMVALVCDKYKFPNGVCLSPDESTLFICSNKPFEKFICTYDAATLRFKNIFAEENSDGIECDRFGNVYLCTKEGIVILNVEGKRLALITLPTIPANLCWGGKDGNDLFITARENIFLIRELQKTVS